MSDVSRSSSLSPAPPALPPSLPDPLTPLADSYTYHSACPTAAGPYHLGVDEAGRGPVLGPLVYAVALCPESYVEKLEDLGFDDSKVLSAETRAKLLGALESDPTNLAWAVRVVSPQAISRGMLQRPPVNLNVQSQEATVLLIKEVLAKGVPVTHVFVDALGATGPYQQYLSSVFPGITFDVRPKADSIFKVVSAASIAAKTTRDAWIENWIYDEVPRPPLGAGAEGDLTVPAAPAWATSERGSGYPSDPKTKVWLSSAVDKTFGFPSIVRFSWATAKLELERSAHQVKWTDEGQTTLVKSFATATGRDKGRSSVAKEFQLRSVGSL
ncbi:ribonuclease H-like protein [Exidia glandulosa HHB12029]|uniref:Ribonuclease n=1 Tax=Exidia glandulosa HHB12029 TaxID=1314781 RepID=A0A166AC70_EXIGL|nr:ribonuclease H-like protein [Exidia glandulosa HHB12029]